METPEQLTLPGVAEHIRDHPLQPHQMFRYQYEADPQTMWRAEGADTLGGSATSFTSSGLHFGEKPAAEQRGNRLATATSESSKIEERPIRTFSLRTKGRFSNEPTASHPAAEDLPQTKGVIYDEDVGRGIWPQRNTGRWYRNDYEGVAGFAETTRSPLSGYVPRRKGFITTHQEEVLKAHAEGKDVSPAILHEAQFRPEYSETIPPAKPEAPEHPKLFVQAPMSHPTSRHFTPEEYTSAVQEVRDYERKGKPLKFTATPGDPVPAGSQRPR